MQDRSKIRIAFLVGSDNWSTRVAIESVCRVANVTPVLVLVDTDRPSFGLRLKYFRKNIRKYGLAYAPKRAVEAMRTFTDTLVDNAIASKPEIDSLLRKAFPSRIFTLSDLAAKYGLAVECAGNLNDSHARELLRKHDIDLGIVIGTRILKKSLFTIPKLGCINLHKGKVPEYRGMPPAFWELYDGVRSVGVTVHFVNEGLDTGDIVNTAEIEIRLKDTPATLLQKLHVLGASALADAVASIQNGTAVRQPQKSASGKAKSKPTFDQIRELQRRLPHWRPPTDLSVFLRNLYCLTVFYSGIYSLVRICHSLHRTRAAVLLYHRINGFSQDPLTVDSETFASHLIAISRHYRSMSTTDLVESLRNGKRIRPTAVVIHFDDCYRDICVNALPLLLAKGFPATAFVTSGFVGTDRSFPHDVEKYPFSFENLRASDIRDWLACGFEVGAHTVNHVDLGACSTEVAKVEIIESRLQIEQIGKQGVKYFAFPFGRPENISAKATEIVRNAGYEAMFSAYDGFVRHGADMFDIPRLSPSRSALHLLLRIEGLTLNQIFGVLQRTMPGKVRRMQGVQSQAT